MSEQAISLEVDEPARLPRHSYPRVVVVAAVVTVAAAVFSFTRAPGLIDAGRKLHSGKTAIAGHDYGTAAAQLERAHEEVPASRKITIALAEADFGVGNNRAGLDLLDGMRISQDEWSTLTQTMPKSIQTLFQPTK
jgi:hypothetical protein